MDWMIKMSRDDENNNNKKMPDPIKCCLQEKDFKY